MTGILTDLPPGYSDARHIGSGGWAEVYQCREASSGDQVALKLFHQRLEDPIGGADRFQQECRTAAVLSAHPGVVKVRAAGITPSASPWLAMDLAIGGTLAKKIRDAGGQLTLESAVDYTIRLADTLAWAHTLPSPVIHGDIKAVNVLLDASGRPLLSDFGVSTHLGTRHSVTVAQFTHTHAAPEVLGDGRASMSSDIWALGVTFYEMLTGTPPFVVEPGEGPKAFIRRVEQGLPADAIPSSVSPAVAEVIRGALKVDRGQRTKSMTEIATALRAAQQALKLPITPPWPTISAPAVPELRFVGYTEAVAVTRLRQQPPGDPKTVDVPSRRRKPLLIAGATAALVLAGVAFAMIRGGLSSADLRASGLPSAASSPSTTPGAGASATSTPGGATPNPDAPNENVPDPQTGPSAPGTVTAFAVLDHNGVAGLDGRLSFSITPPASQLSITRYEIDYNGDGSADTTSTATSGYITGLTNGAQYAVRVRACANQLCGSWSATSAIQQPYGPVPTPGSGASKSGSTQINLTWAPGGTNGRPLSRIEIRVDGGGWENVGTSAGNRLVGNGYNQTHSILVQAIDTAGQVSSSSSASATTNAPPPPQVTVTPGASAQGKPGCSSSACYYIVVTLNNFAPNTGYSCTFNSSLGSGGFVTYNVTTNGSGYFSGQSGNYFGVASGWASATCGGVTGVRNPWL